MTFLPLFPQQRNIIRASTPEEYIDRSQPVLYDGVMQQWAAYPKWNILHLADKFGKWKVSADRKMNGQVSYIQTEMAAYADYIYNTADEVPYYGKSTLHLENNMVGEYQVPAAFHCWYKDYYTTRALTRRIELSCLYFGPSGARSNLHQDIWGSSFWNALFEGKKLWLFFPPEQEHLIYNGEFDPLTADPASFPMLRDTTPVVCIQEPGELIYCPANIWHWAIVLKPSLALSENFINGENYQVILRFFEKQGYANAARKMQEIAGIYLNKS
ncbi:cupin-like domain-containing protein [Chitinophaga sancti]|uniref:Cupin-like domain-containing protein n=1 Tax=Chitinophaga sancti TaxID=1004 RepID=A0A1K1LRK6_9BACT|nr:cupin-like domain-containing protein [Chitinophaga sancti]WQD64900.1 cupin-like domain-containing protein [Chitinophaga sancti]WQG89476.1 cupin-like domain-containing protein [Chitinophaga sancti]SFW13508.1 Cupin-like domain-containing protein [Chitinophaga sancti]